MAGLAGLFGGQAAAAPSGGVGDLTPPGSTLREKIMAAGAMMSGDTALALRIRQMGAQRAQEAQKQDFLSQLATMTMPQTTPGAPAIPGMQGPSMDGDPVGHTTPAQPSTTTPGLNINDPRMAAISILAEKKGVPITTLLEVMKAQQPNVQFDRGFGYNQKTGAAMGGFHPELDKGQVLGPNGVMNLPGAVQSSAEMAGGVEGAKSAAQAPYQAVQTYDAQGRPMTINAMTLANSKTPFVGQSPAQTAADTAVATAGANANVGLPQTLADADQALATISSLKTHPALGDRTGWKGVLPAIPGTSGVDFDASLAQLKGKLFLQAYGQLKGGGQITEVEGKKATEAMARLNQSQTKDGFVKALDDLGSVISAGRARAAQQATRLQPNASGGPHAPRSPAIAAPLADRMAEARRRGLIP